MIAGAAMREGLADDFRDRADNSRVAPAPVILNKGGSEMIPLKFNKGTEVVGKDVNTGIEKRGLYVREVIGNNDVSMVSIEGKKGFIKNAKKKEKS